MKIEEFLNQPAASQDDGISPQDAFQLAPEKKSTPIDQFIAKTNQSFDEKTVYVPETNRVLGYLGDKSYDDIYFDVQVNELKKDRSGFMGKVDMGLDFLKGVPKGVAQFGAIQVPQAIMELGNQQIREMEAAGDGDLLAVLKNPLQFVASNLIPGEKERDD